MQNDQGEQNIVSGLFNDYSDTQKELLNIEIRKTRNKLFTIAIVILVFDFITLASLKSISVETFLMIIVVPAIIVALGFLSLREPLTAVILAALIIFGIWIYAVVLMGPAGIITGWIGKIVIITLLLAGLQHAKQASGIKKELKI